MSRLALHINMISADKKINVIGRFYPEDVNMIRLGDNRPHLVLRNDLTSALSHYEIKEGMKLEIWGVNES